MQTQEIKIDTKFGRKLIIPAGDSFLSTRLAQGPFQKRNLLLLRRLVPKADVIVDAGMMIGMNTIEYATWANIVLGFEPCPDSYRRALINISMAKRTHNSIPWWPGSSTEIVADIRTFQVALGAKKSTGALVQESCSGQNHMVSTHNRTGHSRPTTATAIHTLDQYTKGLNISAIKIDVEGYELQVLQGAEATLARCRPIVQAELIEKNPKRFGATVEGICEWMQEHDYQIALANAQLTIVPEFGYIRNMSDRFFIPTERTARNVRGQRYVVA